MAFGASAIPIRIDSRLRECNYGTLNGAPVEQVEPERLERIDEPFPKGESYREVVARVRTFLSDLVAETPANGSILIIGHRATRYALDCLLAGEDLASVVGQPFLWQEGWEYKVSASALQSVRPALGVKRGDVVLETYSPAWEELGDSERRAIVGVLGALATDVQHIGSTAIPGLDAKPILDLAVGLTADAGVDDIRAKMEGAGYEFRGDKGREGWLLFVKAHGDVMTVHVHLVDADSEEWGNYLRFRDHLRSHSETAAAYRDLKVSLARRFADDRASYTAGKAEFIRDTLQRMGEPHEPLAEARLVIRPAERRDLESIDDVVVEARRDAYLGRLSDAQLRLDAEGRGAVERAIDADDRDEALLVAELAGAVVGFGHAGPSETVRGLGELYAIYVDPAFWGQGIGQALMDKSVVSLRRRGYERAIVWVRETNLRARRFYEAGGWALDGATKQTRVGADNSAGTVGVEIRELRYFLRFQKVACIK